MGSAHDIHDMGVYGLWYGNLPKGCIYCMKGSKAVIFVTGLCDVDCFYCPISYERRRPEAFYVDEEKVKGIADIVDEISMIQAEGVSITGGEPFQVYHLVVDIIKTLKDVLGGEFHIHLYTSGLGATKSSIKYLSSIGLDEIRFHIVNEDVFKLVEFAAKETNMDVGIEVPAIPDFDWLWRIVAKAEEIGVKFININELEVSETNIERVLIRGYRVSVDGRSVEKSSDTASKVIKRAFMEGLRVSVHFCPAIYKDVVQHRNRLKRKALMCISDGDVNQDGTIRIGDEDVIPTFSICSDYIKI